MSSNICSEVAVQKVLRNFGVPRNIDLIPFLKRCESLEAMEPCVDDILAYYHLDSTVTCKIDPYISFADLQKTTVKTPVAIRVTNVINGEPTIHTVNIAGYDPNFDLYMYDEEDPVHPNRSDYIPISSAKLRAWRHGTYGFSCRFTPSRI